MSVKQASKKLCKICGVPPKIAVVYKSFGKSEKLIFKTRKKAEEWSNGLYIKGKVCELYPVFTKDNLIKLMNIKNECSETLIGFLKNYQWEDTEEFVEALADLLEEGCQLISQEECTCYDEINLVRLYEEFKDVIAKKRWIY